MANNMLINWLFCLRKNILWMCLNRLSPNAFLISFTSSLFDRVKGMMNVSLVSLMGWEWDSTFLNFNVMAFRV